MVFIQGSYDIPTTIGLITQALIATDDFELTDDAALDNQNHAGICIKHIPTGQYVSFYASIAKTSATDYSAGVRVIISTAWNAETHMSEGTIYRGHIPMYFTVAHLSAPTHLANITSPNVFATSLWADKYGIVGTIQNTYEGTGTFFSLEFFPSSWVEYDDGHQPIVLYSKRNVAGCDAGVSDSMTDNNVGYTFMRPYRFYTCTTATSNEGSYMEREAYRSEGNNKVYFKFPTYENGLAAGRTAFAETRRWFRVSVTGGIQIGDILNWIDPDEVTVHKFIVCVAKGDSMYYAIPYENAFDYAVSARQ